MNYSLLPPIEIDGENSLIGITWQKDSDFFKINHHTRSLERNEDQGDFKEVTIPIKHLSGLIDFLSGLKNIQQND